MPAKGSGERLDIRKRSKSAVLQVSSFSFQKKRAQGFILGTPGNMIIMAVVEAVDLLGLFPALLALVVAPLLHSAAWASPQRD